MAKPSSPEKSPSDVTEDDVSNIDAVFRMCWQFWQMQPIDACKELGYSNTRDIYQAKPPPWEA